MKKEEKYNVLIYARAYYSFDEKRLEIDNAIMNFRTPANCPDFNDYDIVILIDGFLDLEKEEILRREKEISRAIYQGKGCICFLFQEIISPGKEIKFYPDNPLAAMAENIRNMQIKKIRETSLIGRFMLNLNILPMDFDEEQTQFKVKRSEFKDYFDKYGVTKTYFKFESDLKLYTIIALVNENIAGFAFEHKFFVLPLQMPRKHDEQLLMLRSLIKSILSYSAKVYYEEPPWLYGPVFQNEEALILKINKLKGSIQNIEREIYKYRKYKRVLYLGDDKLTDEVINLLKNGIGLKCQREEKFEEDFWLIKGGEKLAIVEVKGLNGDVGRRHLNQIDSHRDAHELKDSFPAILIANTQMRGVKSLSAKDKPIASDIIKHAVRNKILIIRTIDLIRILDLIEGKVKKYEDLAKIITTEYGWLKADSERWSVLKR